MAENLRAEVERLQEQNRKLLNILARQAQALSAATRRVTALSASRPRRQNGRPSLIYFIASEAGPIKIGCSFDPEDRLASLQTASPHRLRIVKLLDGGLAEERALHDRFAHLRLRPDGEWFAPTEDLLRFISES